MFVLHLHSRTGGLPGAGLYGGDFNIFIDVALCQTELGLQCEMKAQNQPIRSNNPKNAAVVRMPASKSRVWKNSLGEWALQVGRQ